MPCWRGTTSRGTGGGLCVINTCGFIESAKQEAIDTILGMQPQSTEPGAEGGGDGLPSPNAIKKRYERVPGWTRWWASAQYRYCLHPRAAGAGRGGIESYGPKAALPLSAGVSSPRRTTMHI